MNAAWSATIMAVSRCCPATSGSAAAATSTATATAIRRAGDRLTASDPRLAEDAPRTVEQDRDQDGEHDGVPERGGDVQARERLHEPDEEPPDERARHAAEPAQHRDDERFQNELAADERAHEGEGHDDRAGEAGGGRPQRDGDQVHAPHVDADEGGAFAVVGGRANGLPQRRALEEERQYDDGGEADGGGA